MNSNFQDVRDFHDKFELSRDRPTEPRHPPPELRRFRLAFLIEELAEYADASGALSVGLQLSRLAADVLSEQLVVDDTGLELVRAFDALLDLSVVTLGTADLTGLPWQHGWDIVHARNMAKRRARPDGSDSKRGSPFDVVKPPGWHGPEAELAALLRQHGFQIGVRR